MSRKLFISIVACLLCLLPALTLAQSLTRYEYWFDDDFAGRVSGNLSGASDAVSLSIGTDQLENGVHKFSFRARQSDGKYSAITSSLFLKRPMVQSSQMEYWFDDKFDQRDVISISNTDEEQTFDLDLRNNAKYPWGFHKLNMRINIAGEGVSAVYSAGVLKLSAGKATQLEYWVDGDYEHARTISGELASDGKDYKFITDLDLGNVSPGHHRLYCRPVSSSRITAGAVTSVPIIVKSRYNVENIEDLTVTEHAYWFDDDEPEIITITNPENIFSKQYTLDTRKLADGQHTLHLQYCNSAGVWNSPLTQTFTKAHVNAPLIVANASAEDGIVTVNFATIPWGQGYTVVRKYPSGSIRKVEFIPNTQYPAALRSTDQPGPGTYTYYVVGKYIDEDGELQEICSGDMSVTVEQAAVAVKRGTIHGEITLDGKRGVTHGYYRVEIKGENAQNLGYQIWQDPYGRFVIHDVPFGEITIGVNSDNYNFNDVTLIVDENTSHNTYLFNGTKEGDELPDNSTYDLKMTQPVKLTPNVFEVAVKNLSSKPWNGNLIVMVINKKAKDKYDERMNSDDPSYWDKLKTFFATETSCEDVPLYTTAANMHVHVDGKLYQQGSKVYELDIVDLPETNKNEDYYVYVFSQKDGTGQLKELDTSYQNPQVLNFNPFNCAIAQEKDYKSYIEEYKTVLRHLKELSKWGDPFALEIKTFGDDYEAIIDNLGSGKYVDYDGFAQDLIVNTSHSAGMLLSVFLSDVHKEVKNAAKLVTNSGPIQVANGLEKVINRLESIYGSYTNVDDNIKFFETSKQVLRLCDDLDLRLFPALKVYKTYFDVGAAMASAVSRLENNYSGWYIWERLVSGKGIHKIMVRKYSAGKNWEGYFSGSDLDGQIRSIDFVLKAPGIELPSLSCKKELTSDGIIVKDVVFPGVNNSNYASTEAWMIITWNNNRVTRVPLLDGHFVKKENFNQTSSQPPIMTVELQSEANLNNESIANKLTFVEQD